MTVGDKKTVTVEEVENMSDEELELYTGGGKKKQETTGPGTMMEYGWWDEEIEADVDLYMNQYGVNRENAIIRVFNEK